MAKEEKADSDKRGWFARWRERRAWNKSRQGDIGRRYHDALSKDALRDAPRGGRGGGGGLGGP
jgi:hypothetical protein